MRQLTCGAFCPYFIPFPLPTYKAAQNKGNVDEGNSRPQLTGSATIFGEAGIDLPISIHTLLIIPNMKICSKGTMCIHP